MRPRTNCMLRWTGCASGKRGSRRSSLRGICVPAGWCSMTCLRAISKVVAVLWPASATTVMARRKNCRATTGCPVGVSVYEGNPADAKTLLPQVTRLRDDFGIDTLVIVGDRGMISQKAIDELRGLEGVAWITALKSAQIRLLLDQGNLQLGLFDQRNLVELPHPDFPGERLMACRNPQ